MISSSNSKQFDFKEMPIAYFNDNVKANNLRSELIKNVVLIFMLFRKKQEKTYPP